MYKSLFENIIKTYFHGKSPAGIHPLLLILFPSPFSMLGVEFGRDTVSCETPERAEQSSGRMGSTEAKIKRDSKSREQQK